MTKNVVGSVPTFVHCVLQGMVNLLPGHQHTYGTLLSSPQALTSLSISSAQLHMKGFLQPNCWSDESYKNKRTSWGVEADPDYCDRIGLGSTSNLRLCWQIWSRVMFTRVDKDSWGTRVLWNWVHLSPEEQINPCFKQHLLWRELLVASLCEPFRRLFSETVKLKEAMKEWGTEWEAGNRGEGCPCFRV